MSELYLSIVYRTLLVFLLIGSVAGILLGALLICRPHEVERLSGWADRWISTRRLDRRLNNIVAMDRLFYRHRHLVGGLTALGALYILHYFTFALDQAAVVEGLWRRYGMPRAYSEWLLDAVVLVGILGALFALIISLFILFRPSLLREFEEGANQWLSVRRALKPLEIPRHGVNEFILQHARRIGIVLVLGGLYALLGLLAWAG